MSQEKKALVVSSENAGIAMDGRFSIFRILDPKFFFNLQCGNYILINKVKHRDKFLFTSYLLGTT